MATDWTGFYLGVHAGGAWGDVDIASVTSPDGDFDFDPPEAVGLSPDGVLGGGQFGYNFQMTNWVFGLEVSGSGLDFDDSITNPWAPGTTEWFTTEVEWLVLGVARLGWSWDSSLLYLKGGWAGGGVNTAHFDTQGPDDEYFTDETHNGWTAGAGWEHAIGDHVSFGVEYNYIDLGEQEHSGVTRSLLTETNDVDVQLHTVVARLNFHLNPL